MFAHFSRWHAVAIGLLLGTAVGVFTLVCNSQPSSPGQPVPDKGQKKPTGDYKEVNFLDLNVELLTPEPDKKTGFLVAGKNASSLIRGLKQLNGRSIQALEEDMRPGKSSKAGFLGKDEKLLDVLVTDNEYVVDQLGMSHQELARQLFAMEAIWRKLEGKTNGTDAVRCTYNGRRFEIKVDLTRGFQDSPFQDGTKTNAYFYVTNVDNGQKLEFSGLVPIMVERYGFYEGKGTSFRGEPKQIAAVFDFLKSTGK